MMTPLDLKLRLRITRKRPNRLQSRRTDNRSLDKSKVLLLCFGSLGCGRLFLRGSIPLNLVLM